MQVSTNQSNEPPIKVEGRYHAPTPEVLKEYGGTDNLHRAMFWDLIETVDRKFGWRATKDYQFTGPGSAYVINLTALHVEANKHGYRRVTHSHRVEKRCHWIYID